MARTSAQFESNRKRMKDLEEKQSKSLPAIDHNSCEEVSKLRRHLSDMELQLQDLQDSSAGKDASIQALQQQLASSQDLVRSASVMSTSLANQTKSTRLQQMFTLVVLCTAWGVPG